MSTHQPGASRRRRIAGERRGRTAASTGSTSAEASPVEDAPVEDGPRTERTPLSERPVLIEKGPRSPFAPFPPEPSAEPDDDSWSDDGDLHDDHDGGDAGDRSTDLPESASRRGGWWGSKPSLVLLSALLAALLALTGLAALGVLGTDGLADVNDAEAVERSERTAPAAAEAAAAAILAYDWKSLDADQDSAARYMTAEFADEYAETFEKVVRPAAEQNRAKVTATVLASAVVSATETTAKVLVFVDQATVSKANPRPQIALNRVEMSMVREGDGWQVADISSY